MFSRNRSLVVLVLALAVAAGYMGCTTNQSPIIQSIVAPDSVLAGDTAVVVCQASDPDGDALTFTWTADNGSFAETSAGVAQWVAPLQAGVYDLQVAVSDGTNDPVDTLASIRVSTPANSAPEAVVLAAPANVTRTTVDLAWTQSPDADFARYELHRAMTAGFTPSAATRISQAANAGDTTAVATGLTPGAVYFFKVVVVDAGDLTAVSNEVSARTQYYRQLGTVVLPGRPVGLDIAGDIALVANRAAGLQLVSFSNPNSPTKVGAYELADQAHANDVFAQRPYAYVAFSDSGLHVVDFATPADPQRTARTDTAVKSVYAVTVNGSYAYIASEQKLFTVIDVSMPSLPIREGQCSLPDDATGLAVAGDYAYAACGYSGLRVLDVSRPDAPLDVIGVATADKANRLYVAGDYAYVAANAGGLEIIDITRPTNPILVSRLALPGDAYDVYVAGNYAYVACWDQGLQVIDVGDPRNPFVRYTADLPGCLINGVATAGPYVFLTDWNYEFIVLGP